MKRKLTVLVPPAVLVTMAFFTLVVGACATTGPTLAKQQCYGEMVWDDDIGLCVCPKGEVANPGTGYTGGLCLTEAEVRARLEGVSLSDKPEHMLVPVLGNSGYCYCEKGSTWTDEKCHQECDDMCSLLRGKKWNTQDRECFDFCDRGRGLRWSYADQACVSICRGGTFKGWGENGVICDCPEGQSWNKHLVRCTDPILPSNQ